MHGAFSGVRSPSSRAARRGGFTLLELVVATTVFLILSLMIGALFRQAASAWDAGRVRGEGGMIARGILGSISRDLATAVDGRPYGKDLPTASGTVLKFVCLKKLDGDGALEPHYIEYNGTTRSDWVWKKSGWQQNGNPINLGETDNTSFKIEKLEFTEIGLPDTGETERDEEGTGFGAKWTGPAAVKVRLVFEQSGAFSGLEIRSLGKNGVEDGTANNNNDDIVVR